METPLFKVKVNNNVFGFERYDINNSPETNMIKSFATLIMVNLA